MSNNQLHDVFIPEDKSECNETQEAMKQRPTTPWLNLSLLLSVVDRLEEAGNVQAMWTIVEYNAPQIEKAAQAEAQRILVALRARVAAAKQKEAVGGRGSLLVYNHPINVKYRAVLAHNPEWRLNYSRRDSACSPCPER